MDGGMSRTDFFLGMITVIVAFIAGVIVGGIV